MEIRHLPLSALQTFLYAARCLSFTQASKQLFVTQGAVSQQILKLEQELGFKLFIRLPQKLVLTEEGKRLQAATEQALNLLADTITDMQHSKPPSTFTISMARAFASHWFISRVENLQKLFPTTDIRVNTDRELVDFKAGNIDVAIRYGRGDYSGLMSTRLIDLSLFPICSPKLLEKHSPLDTPNDLRAYPLIHHNTFIEGKRESIWKIWANAYGLDLSILKGGIWFNDRSMALQAAVEGKGIAIGNGCLSFDDLQKGALIKLFDFEYPIAESYYLVCPQNSAQAPSTKLLRQWLLQQFSEVKI